MTGKHGERTERRNGKEWGDKTRAWGVEQEKWQREAGRKGWSCQRCSDASFGGPGALHPDTYLMSSYSASVPMIW